MVKSIPARFSVSAMNSPDTPAPATTTRNLRPAITPHITKPICVSPKFKSAAAFSTTQVTTADRGFSDQTHSDDSIPRLLLPLPVGLQPTDLFRGGGQAP